MTAILAAALPSKSNSPAMHEQRRRPTTISPTVQSPIWRQQRGKSPLSKGRAQRPESIVDELTGLLINDNGGSANQKFSKGAHRFPVELSLDSPECNSEASTSSSIDSTGSTQMLLPDSPWKDQIPPKSTSDLDEQTNILLRPNRRLLHSEPRELDALRRWSAMSITSTGTLPPDAVNCDCTSLAWAALRSSTARKRRLQSQKQKQDESYRKISGTNGNFSTDSGLGSSSGSEDSHSQSGNLTPMANKPPMARKRRKRSLSLIGLMRRMFDGDRRKSTSSKASLIAPSPSIINVASSFNYSINEPHSIQNGTFTGKHSLQNGHSYAHSSTNGFTSSQNGRPPSFQSTSSAYSSRFLQNQRNKLLSTATSSIFEPQQKTPASAAYGFNDRGMLSSYPSSRLSPSHSSTSIYSNRRSSFPVSSSSLSTSNYTNSSLIDRKSPAPFSAYSDLRHLPSAPRFARLHVDNYTSSALTSRLSPAPSRLNEFVPKNKKLTSDPDARALIKSPERPVFSKSMQRRLRSIDFGITAHLNRRRKEQKALEAEDSQDLSDENASEESSYEDESEECESEYESEYESLSESEEPAKQTSKIQNDIGGFSPKWRDDVILNEASPLHHRLSMDNAPVQTTAFRDEHQNKLYSSPQISSNAQTTKQVAFNGSATPKQPATVQPLQRNGSPSLTEKPNATIAGANRQPVQNSFSQQPKQQPVAQKTLSSTLVSNKTPISSSTTFGTVPTANLTTSTFNAAPIQQNKQPPALQNRSPHALPHQPVVQHRPAAKPQQPRQPNIAGRLANCPQFHYPAGRPIPRAENDAVREKVRQLFNANTAHPQQLEYKDMDKLCQAIGLAVYSKRAVYEACMRLNAVTVDPNMTILPSMTLNQFNTYWQLMTADCHDEASRFIFTLAAAATGERKPRTYLVRDDFTNILVDLIHTYPGLSFLVNSTQFHSKYCEVVIVRIFWNVNRSWTGRITAHELRKSDFLPTLHLLETISDINKITDYFSYEHFYVAYCKFWELDTNHDLIIDREDMRQHCNGAIPDVVIDRVFSGAVMRNIPKLPVKTKGPVKTLQVETIGFEDFVAFLLAEEDKKHPTSVEYWFRILDLNGDGLISLYEMEYFYREIEAKLTQHNFDTLAFRDVACNLFDSIAPSTRGFVTLKELKKCGLAHRFFNTFVNYLKYLEQESSEGERASVKSSGDREMSDWETYCALEYELLLTDNDVEYDENIDLTLDDSEEKNVATKTVE